MVQLALELARDEEGQAVVEYGLVIGIVVVGAVALVLALTGQFNAFFERIGQVLQSAF